MEMKMSDTPQPDINARYRTLLVLWGAICMSVTMFLVVVLLNPVTAVDNRTLTLVLNTVGIIPVALSFPLKQRGLAKAVREQRLDLVQSTYILCFALCESSALLGLVDHFSNGSGFYYIAFAIAGAGLLLHFPQKKNLVNASSYKSL
jgi:hypothetical protein